MKNYEDVFKKALFTWGETPQLNMLIEEMSELTKEICKYFRGNDNRIELVDEISDVTIMLQQAKLALNISDEEIDNHIDFKIKRIIERLNR